MVKTSLANRRPRCLLRHFRNGGFLLAFAATEKWHSICTRCQFGMVRLVCVFFCSQAFLACALRRSASDKIGYPADFYWVNSLLRQQTLRGAFALPSRCKRPALLFNWHPYRGPSFIAEHTHE